MTLQQAKNALVASLFELSNAATSAATATVEFYKQAGLDGAETAGSELNDLSSSIASAADSVATKFNGVSNGTATPRKRAPKRKADANETPSKGAPDAEGHDDTATTSAEIVVDDAEVPEEKEKAKPEKKKRKVEKDPNAPKKPLTSYLRFNLQIRDSLRKERVANGDQTLPAVELNQIIAEKWSNLTNEEKTSLQQEYDKEFEAYKKALEKYKLEKLEASAAPTDSSSTVATNAPSTPKKKVTIKAQGDSEFQPEESPVAQNEEKAESRVEKKKKAKSANESPAVPSVSSGDDNSSSKKLKKKKEKDSEKSKKKKAE